MQKLFASPTSRFPEGAIWGCQSLSARFVTWLPGESMRRPSYWSDDSARRPRILGL